MTSQLRRAALGAIWLGLALAGPARAAEAPSHPFRFEISNFNAEPFHYETIEGPCGLAVDSFGDVYVGNYYHDEIDAFYSSGGFINRLAKEEPADGPCGLAVDSGGRLYVNNLHRNVLRFALRSFPPPTYPYNSLTSGAATTIDSAHPTGVALDPSDNVYVDDRTYIAKYSPTGSLLAKIGLGSLQDGYGVAVSGYAPTNGLVYVPDAATATVKVYEPGHSPELVAEIDGRGTPQGGFASLRGAAVAVDNADGHVFVADDLQGVDTEHPTAALDEFNPAGEYRGQLPSHPALLASEPTGVAIDNSGGSTQGDVYVTSGNTELAKVYAYGPTGPAHRLTLTKSGSGSGTVRSEPAGIDCGSACAAEYSAGATVTLTATPASGSAFGGWSGACTGSGACTVAMGEDEAVGAEFKPAPVTALAAGAGGASGASEPAAARRSGGGAQASEILQQGDLRISTTATMRPSRLPRNGAAPISVSVAGHIQTTDESRPPQITALQIAINRHGRLDFQGLPVCQINRIQPASDARALAACRSALVGQGKFFGTITLPGAAPYPLEGRLLLFNGQEHGRQVLYGHIYAERPFATSFVIVFRIEARRQGAYGTVLSADLLKALGSKRNLTGIEMTLSRRWRSGGRSHSYLSAGCPAPKGFPGAVFPLARTTFSFTGRGSVAQTLRRSCTARG